MNDSIFNYIGSYLHDGIQHRELNNIPETLKIVIGNIDLNTSEKQVTIMYNIDLLNNDEMVSHYSFFSLFHIEDETFTNSFLNTLHSEQKVFDELCSNVLIAMIRFSFPFIRQMVQSMTNDIAGAILLPLIDASVLLQQGLEFKREIAQRESTTEIAKPVRKKRQK